MTKVLDCENCPFEKDQVFGEGCDTIEDRIEAIPRDSNDTYDVVGVGMAPAYEEIREGRPFVGKSGQLLRKVLWQNGVKKYYLCNVLLCPIPDEATEEQKRQAQECCHDVVEEVLSKHPKLTIAFGDMPLHTLMDTDYKIKECEGRVLPSKVGPLLPLAHPAYYLRNYNEAFDFIECMRPGVQFLRGDYRQAGEPELEVVTSDNLSQVKAELWKAKELAMDTETTGFNAYGWTPDHLLEMGLSAPPYDKAYIVPAEMIPEFKDHLEQKDIIGWNFQFDASFLKCIGITPKASFDGMLAHYTIDERPYSHGLKRVARIYLGTDDWEKELDKWIPARQKKSVSYEVVPRDVRYDYLAKDVTRTGLLKEAIKDDVNQYVFNELLMPACRMFIEIAHKGQRVNPVKIMNLEGIITKQLDEMESNLMKLTGRYINPLSPKDVANYLYNTLGLPVDPRLGFTTSKAYLEMYRDQYEVVDLVLDFREMAKVRGTYVEGLAHHVDQDFRIHPSIKLFGSITGRLSSENPSIMNIKRLGALKEIFLPEEDQVFLYSDLKQNELRWYYLRSGDEDLGAILKAIPTPENPRANDPHYLVSRVAYGEENADRFRTEAKAVVFGRLYKRGRKDIERQVGKEVIDKLMQTVDGIFPNVGKYYSGIMKEIRSKGYVESFFGRKRKFIILTQENLHDVEKEAGNFPLQSAGSDLMLLNFLHLWEIRNRWGIWPFWPYHDSITMNSPTPKIMPEIRKEMEEYSYDVVEKKVPCIWEFQWGTDWWMASNGKHKTLDLKEGEKEWELQKSKESH